MIERWESQLAAELAVTRLAEQYRSDPIVHAYLMAARRGDCDLLTALAECIKTLSKLAMGQTEKLTALQHWRPFKPMFEVNDDGTLPRPSGS